MLLPDGERFCENSTRYIPGNCTHHTHRLETPYIQVKIYQTTRHHIADRSIFKVTAVRTSNRGKFLLDYMASECSQYLALESQKAHSNSLREGSLRYVRTSISQIPEQQFSPKYS
jgi:hypothetical protein